jgi:hypothetical protein
MPSSIVKVVNKPAEKKATAPMENTKAEKMIPKDASSTDNKKKKKKRSNKQSLETCKTYMFNVLKKILMLKNPPTQLYQHLWTTAWVKPVGDTNTVYLN